MPEGTKVCPIFVIRPVQEKGESRQLDIKEGAAANCIQRKCAWWVITGGEDGGECAVVRLAALSPQMSLGGQ